jgi:DNA (cytosine-5)-methyltransferase 1
MRFVDLFAGLGGFNLALSSLGHECVFACEIDDDLRDLYVRNFRMRPRGDIRTIDATDIPDHEILCAGFPCQPFSKAGDQQGFSCSKWGDLFEFVIETIGKHKPDYFILENVPNITKHDNGRTWRAIVDKLRTPEWGYQVNPNGRLSPHQFGVPQVRDRIFIVGSRHGLDSFHWPVPNGKRPSLGKILDRKPPRDRRLPLHYIRCLDAWQEFVRHFPTDRKMPSFPIWSMEFSATYPFEDVTPFELLKTARGRRILQTSRGSHGRVLAEFTSDAEIMGTLPSYARSQQSQFPRWKVQFIRQNRELYQSLRPWVDEWIPRILPLASSLQKLEWNYQEGERDIWQHVIQMRASGVRVKAATTAPSLVAMTTTQVPIVGRSRAEKRFMTMREAARLQSMHRLKHLPSSESVACQALGNAVNVEVVRRVAQALLSPTTTGIDLREPERRPTRLDMTINAA